ncbi:ankyrin repeat domain-containing protein 2 isoform X2 [Osmerus eperlanus]|uniref:ankyrin repeat domain-containing protein 2 isoform X2 n=1 Tax=Osmerus eperlanus TaxID=29151 RepID=UPI002E0D441A
MEGELPWPLNVVNQRIELENVTTEHRRARALRLGHITGDSSNEDEGEKNGEPTNQTVADIQVEARVRKTSSDLRREIVDLGGAENFAELRQKKKTRKKGFSARVPIEMPVLDVVNKDEFMNAAIQGKLNVVVKYLSDGGDPNTCDELRRTALHRASMEGHIMVIQKLLENGADITLKDRLDSRAVHWASRGGRLGVLKVLHSHGADLNVRDKAMSSPLHVATRTGHADVVDFLISNGAKINAKDREGDTALHDAVRLNRYKIVHLLIVAGADTKIQNYAGLIAVEQVKQWQFDTKETLEKLEQLRLVGLIPS